jgi:hypothetical protein
MDTATAILTAEPCTEAPDCVILANLVWLSAHGYRISASREFIVDPLGASGFTVGLLGEAGLTPATMRAA